MPARVAGALALGLLLVVGGTEARAAAASIAAGNAPVPGGHGHGHHCKCRMHCKSACCCTPEETKPATPATPISIPHTSPDATSDGGAGPCLKAAPCGGTAIPTASPGVRLGATAALAVEAVLPPATAGVVVPIPLALIPPLAAPTRIDEPPEPHARA